MTLNQYLLIAYVASLILMSLIAMFTYMHDKKLAIKGAMRVKEKTLLLLSVLNGGVGSLIGRIIAHHKTDKIYFTITIYLSILCEALVLVVLGYFAFVA